MLGAKLAAPDREVYVMVGDGSFQMMSNEITTAVQEGLKLIVVLVDNKGFSSVGRVSEQVGAEGFGCHYRLRGPSGAYDGPEMQLDFVRICQGMGARALEVRTLDELRAALQDARAGTETVCIVVQTDWHERVRGYANSWWEMATPQVSEMPAVNAAREEFDRNKGRQRYLMIPGAPFQQPAPSAASRRAMDTSDRLSSPLLRVVATTPTELWNDSCAAGELEYAIANGATGATSNPPLVLDALRQEPEPWTGRARELYAATPTATEADLAWRIAEEIAVRGAGLLEPVFERTGGRRGRLSIQVSPVLYRDATAMVEQAADFAGLAPNLQVKLPVTTAGPGRDRGGDGPGDQRQRNGQLHGPGCHRRGRGRRTGAVATGGRRSRRDAPCAPSAR